MKKKKHIYTLSIFGVLISLTVYLVTRVASLAVLIFILVSIGFMGLRSPRQKSDAENATVADIESFLMMFAGELRHGLSPEKAFEETLKNCDDSKARYLRKVKEHLYSSIPLSDALTQLGHELPHIECRELLSLVGMLIEKDSIVAGKEITQMVIRLRENRRLIEDEERTRKAMSFKVRVLVITCSISLSIITAMLPMFSVFTQILYGSFVPTYVGREVNWSVALVLSLTLAISAYYSAKAILVEKPYNYVVLSQIFFWPTLLAASTFLTTTF